MTAIEKFASDIRRTVKHDRADNGGRYDGVRACTRIAALFTANNRGAEGVARQIADYWLSTYIRASADTAGEPTDENVARLLAFQSFLDAGDAADMDVLSAEDWENLREFVDSEAESLPLDVLQSMMGTILERGAL